MKWFDRDQFSRFDSHQFSSDSIEIRWFLFSVINFHEKTFSSLVDFFSENNRDTQTLVDFLQTLDSFLCSVSAFSVSTYGLLHNTLYRSLIFSVEKNFEKKKFNSVVVVFFPGTAHEASEFRSAESFVSFILQVSGVTEVGSFWSSLKVEIIDLLIFLKIIVSNWPFFSFFSLC